MPDLLNKVGIVPIPDWMCASLVPAAWWVNVWLFNLMALRCHSIHYCDVNTRNSFTEEEERKWEQSNLTLTKRCGKTWWKRHSSLFHMNVKKVTVSSQIWCFFICHHFSCLQLSGLEAWLDISFICFMCIIIYSLSLSPLFFVVWCRSYRHTNVSTSVKSENWIFDHILKMFLRTGECKCTWCRPHHDKITAHNTVGIPAWTNLLQITCICHQTSAAHPECCCLSGIQPLKCSPPTPLLQSTKPWTNQHTCTVVIF